MKTAIQRGAAERSGHDPRVAALRIVDSVLDGTEASQAVLDKVLRESIMVPSDKGLCTELVYGYLRWSIRLDWDLRRFLQKPEKLPREMLLTLGLAAYELAFLSRIPAHASVNGAVTRVRNRFGKGLAGVANGVLRAFAREAKTYADESRYNAIADMPERLGVVYSLPAWIVRLWLGAYDEATARAYMVASSSQPTPAVRVNAFRDGAAGFRNSLVNDHAGVIVGSYGAAFPAGVPYIARGLEKEGRLSYQSAAVLEILEEMKMPTWQGPVWDACAGRGGKTVAMLERGVRVVAATDRSAARIGALPGELARLGLDKGNDITVQEADATHPPTTFPFSDKFAVVVADVPCSGLGTLSRRPEIRSRRVKDDIAMFIATQDAILDSAARHVQDNGRIVYLTCTLNPAENEERVRAFLTRSSGFSVSKEWATPPNTPWNEFLYGAVLCKG